MRPLALILLAGLAACQTADDGLVLSDSPEPGGIAQTVPLDLDDVDDLAARLQGAGVEMTLESYSESNARVLAGATYTLPDGGTVLLFEYPTADARAADLPYLTAQGGPGGAARVYTAADRFAVVYSGADADTQAALADLLDAVE